MDKSVLSLLLKLYEEAFETRDQEHLWYHFWSEVFVHLNGCTRNTKQMLSVAPQRRYDMLPGRIQKLHRFHRAQTWCNPPHFSLERTALLMKPEIPDEPIVTRSHNTLASAHSTLPETEDKDSLMEDISFGSEVTSEDPKSLEIKIQHCTPDFTIFQYLVASNELTPCVIMENKPLDAIKAVGCH
jgi:hypothetical protein